MHILITGGAGFIGTALSNKLLEKGHQVTSLDLRDSSLGRVRSVKVNLLKPLDSKLFEDIDGIIHLAGKSILDRWDEQVKKLIHQTRVEAAHNIFDAVRQINRKPAFFFSASAIGYYGDRDDEWLDENSVAGKTMLAQVCVDWEAATKRFEELGMRTIAFRHGHVLEKHGGLLGTMLPFYRLGLGGPIGKGQHFISWIHLDDLLDLYVQAANDISASGVYNAVSGTPVRFKEFSTTLARVLGRPHFVRIPKFALTLRFGKGLANEITSSQRVKSSHDFVNETIRQKDLERALTIILSK